MLFIYFRLLVFQLFRLCCDFILHIYLIAVNCDLIVIILWHVKLELIFACIDSDLIWGRVESPKMPRIVGISARGLGTPLGYLFRQNALDLEAI
jgi:hypothetical protein